MIIRLSGVDTKNKLPSSSPNRRIRPRLIHSNNLPIARISPPIIRIACLKLVKLRRLKRFIAIFLIIEKFVGAQPVRISEASSQKVTSLT